MAPVGDVGVELPRARREPFAVVARVEDDRAVADEKRPCVEEVTLGLGGELLARRETDALAVDGDAPAVQTVSPEDRLVRNRPAGGAEVAQGPVRVTKEEAADDRFVDPVRGTPDIEALRLREVHDPHASRGAWVARRVERRDADVGELRPPQQVLDVSHGHASMAARVDPGAERETRRRVCEGRSSRHPTKSRSDLG
jgi:hypothetical protein